MKTVKTWKELLNHHLIIASKCVKDYDGKGKHLITCIDGYEFEKNNSTIEIGNVKELCYEVNNWLEKRD